MAEFWSNNDRGYRLKLWLDQIGQSVAGNNSQVRVRLFLHNTTTTFAQYNCSAYVDVNGQRLNWSGAPGMTAYNTNITLIDQTVTIGHNDDGSKSFGFSAHFNGSGGFSPGNLDLSGNFQLTTIPRASSVSVTNGQIGSQVTITIAKKIPGVKHVIRYAWYGKEKTIASNVDTSYSWTIPNNFVEEIPDMSSSWGTVFCDTYQNGVKIGTSSTTFTASIGGTARPTLKSITLTDTNTVTQNLIPQPTHFVSILSQIRVTFVGASGASGSKITGYYAEIVEEKQSVNTNNGTFQPVMVDKDKEVTIRARVSDSRGQWSDWVETKVIILYYFSPTLRFDVRRKGEKADILVATRWARVAPLTVDGGQKNTMKLTFKVARVGSDRYVQDKGSVAGEWAAISSLDNSMAEFANNYPADKSFVVIGRIEDKFTYIDFQTTVGTNQIVWSYDRQGIGVNKYRENGALDIKGFIYANDKQIQHHRLTESDGTLITEYKITDLDDYKTTGYYQAAHTVANYPIQSATGQDQTGSLEVMAGPFGIQQTLTTMSGRVFRRSILGKNVGAWQEYQVKQEVIKQNIRLPYGMSGRLVRQGNLVTLSLNRIVTEIASMEYTSVNETLPIGYRPSVPTTLNVAINNQSNVGGIAILHFEVDGKMYLTNNISGRNVVTGTVCYITDDPYPS